MDNIIAVLLFILGFALLIAGGKLFVGGAHRIAQHYRLSEFLMGATVLSICTTLPEVMVSSQAAAGGNAGFSYGNAIGSIICNAALVAAVTIVLRPAVKVKPETFSRGTSFFFIAAFFYSVVAWTAGRFDRWAGIVLLIIFVVFEVVLALYMKKHHEGGRGKRADEKPAVKAQAEPERKSKKTKIPWRAICLLIMGAAAIAVGARLLVNNGTIIARALGVPDSVIGLTMVALGTSLPELITAIEGRRQGLDELWLGNIVGANVLNLVLVSGMAITISPFAVPAEKTIGGVNSSFVIDMPLMILAMAVLCLPALFRSRVRRWQGILLLCLYAAFTGYQFV